LTNLTFQLGDSFLNIVTQIKDIGVIFNNQLSFSNHISAIINKSNQRLFLLHKFFLTKNSTVLILAYKTYVLPILDYFSVVWTPHEITEIRRIESVQRMFTKSLAGFGELSYSERLVKVFQTFQTCVLWNLGDLGLI